MPATPAHDWLRPRLQALVDDAMNAGFERDVVVAVLIDRITSPDFNAPPPGGDKPNPSGLPDPNEPLYPDHDPGEPV